MSSKDPKFCDNIAKEAKIVCEHLTRSALGSGVVGRMASNVTGSVCEKAAKSICNKIYK